MAQYYKKEEEKSEFEERVVTINRCAKVLKGGRKFSFSALVVTGNHKGTVGVGFGKANEVSDAIRKASNAAKNNLFSVPRHALTVPHDALERHSGAKVLIKPASPGTGLIAGGARRGLLELAGIRDVLAKAMGSNNALNVVRATEKALKSLESREEILIKRGLKKA
ncbi:MAG: 30S ribosomal protein S5 [Lentisphaeraceae bacterium]|nr:30S ribosomal protein S5 [Lentisphaeraceae bacterium]